MDYTVDQVVKVFRWASAGYGRVMELPDEDGAYTVAVVMKDGWAPHCCVQPEDLKPGTKNDEKKMLTAEAVIETRREDLRKDRADTLALLQQLAEEPLTLAAPLDIDNLHGFQHLLQALVSPLDALRFEDDLSRSCGMTSGYRGCKKTVYLAGERVRPRTGADPRAQQRFKLVPGMVGTVQEGDGLLDCFPVRPGQPSGVTVLWDGSTDINLVYVTEIEDAT